MEELELARGLRDRICSTYQDTPKCKYDVKTSIKRIDPKRLNSMVCALDWKACPLKKLVVLVAIKVADDWLCLKAGGISRLSQLDDAVDGYQITTSDFFGKYSSDKDELETLRAVLEFVSRVSDKAGPLLVNETQSLTFFSCYKEHATWAQKMRKAVEDHGEIPAQERLAKQLKKENVSIPLYFIKFLTSQGTDKATQIYQEMLLQGTCPKILSKFLPATSGAKEKSESAERLILIP